jgi:hypothetical protein
MPHLFVSQKTNVCETPFEISQARPMTRLSRAASTTSFVTAWSSLIAMRKIAIQQAVSEINPILLHAEGFYTSTDIATAPPPPRHRVARPRPPPRRRSSWINVISRREPLEPMG